MSLLRRLKSDEEGAWQRLSYLYTPLIYHWCRKAGLQNSDSADISQEVMYSVSKTIGSFRHDRAGDTFRGWLWTITRNKILSKARDDAKRREWVDGEAVERMAIKLPEQEPDDFDESGKTGKKTALLARCLKVVKEDFEENTWAAFELTMMNDWNATQAGKQLGMTSNAVRKAKSRVLRRIRDEYEGLISLEGENGLS